MDRPWRVDDEVRFPFLVANIVDLNVVPGAPNAVRAVMSKPVGCCGGGGFLAAEVSSAFVYLTETVSGITRKVRLFQR